MESDGIMMHVECFICFSPNVVDQNIEHGRFCNACAYALCNKCPHCLHEPIDGKEFCPKCNKLLYNQ